MGSKKIKKKILEQIAEIDAPIIINPTDKAKDNKKSKLKKVKTATLYGETLNDNEAIWFAGRYYVPRECEPKTILEIPDFSMLCRNYLQKAYKNSGKGLLTTLLKAHYYVSPPYTNLYGNLIYDDKSLPSSAEVHNKITQCIKNPSMLKKLEIYTSYISELSKIVVLRNDFISDICADQGSSKKFNILLQMIKDIYKRASNLMTATHMGSVLSQAGVYYTSCAEFNGLIASRYSPYIGIVRYYATDVESKSPSRYVFSNPVEHFGVLIKVGTIRGGETVLIDKDIEEFPDWESFLDGFSDRKIGKIVGRDIFLNPWDDVMIFPNPLLTYSLMDEEVSNKGEKYE